MQSSRALAHRRCLAIVNAEVLLDGRREGPRAAEHAGRGAAHQDVVLAHGRAVEHGVECGDLHTLQV